MIKDFKFFRPSKTRINWQLTGLLDDATNVPLLIGVLDITYKYIQDNNLMDNDRVKNMLIIIMTKLYRDKYNSYSDYDIRRKIDEIGCELVSFGTTSITLCCEVRNKDTKKTIIKVDKIVFVLLDEEGRPKAHNKKK